MCFSANMSLALGLIGIAMSIHLYKKNIYASIGIGYFALMEIIQYFQYQVINQCNSSYNKFLTILGYLHICFQPLFINIWLFAFTKKPNVTFLYMSFIAGLLLASRLFVMKDEDLCDTKNEPLCGPTTCSFSGTRHIAWNIRLRAPGKSWFTPSLGLHFFMWVIPTLVAFQINPILAMVLTGPYLAVLVSNNIHEIPAIWCFTGIAQMIITYYLIK